MMYSKVEVAETRPFDWLKGLFFCHVVYVVYPLCFTISAQTLFVVCRKIKTLVLCLLEYVSF